MKLRLKALWLYVFHDLLGYHEPMRGGTRWGDGVTTYARCVCGRRIALDHQGNWYICEPHSGTWR